MNAAGRLARPAVIPSPRDMIKSAAVSIRGPGNPLQPLRPYTTYNTTRRGYATPSTAGFVPLAEDSPPNGMNLALKTYNTWRSKHELPAYTASNVTATWIAPTEDQTPQQRTAVQTAIQDMMEGLVRGTIDHQVTAHDEMIFLFAHPSFAMTKEWTIQALFPDSADLIKDIAALPGVQYGMMDLAAWIARIGLDGSVDLEGLAGLNLSTMQYGLGLLHASQGWSLQTALETAEVLVGTARLDNGLPLHKPANRRFVHIVSDSRASSEKIANAPAQVEEALTCVQGGDGLYGRQQDYDSIVYLCVAPALSGRGVWSVIPLFPDRKEVLRQIAAIPAVEMLSVVSDEDGNSTIQSAQALLSGWS